MTPDPEIRELDAETRDRIAAGEVIERPASVVKELVENALDADADRIEVAVEGGGADRIVVADDGVGMSSEGVAAAVDEHTTSKLRSVEELDAIGTLGFRGEALHAIGSVARLRIETKPRGGTRGTALVVEHGDVVSREPVGCPEGTSVEVTELFGSVPARRKYLKTDATEFDHVRRVVVGYALARPDVAVRLSRDGREAFATTGDGDRRSAVMAVYGRVVASEMIPLNAGGDGGPLSGVDGLVSHPETNRAGGEYVTTLIDGRYVTAGAIRGAVVDAYGDRLAPDRYPFAVIDCSVPPGGVDVNVHPRKLDVLFADESGVERQVSNAVEDALAASGRLRSSAPRGASAPEQTEVAPGANTDADTDTDTGAGDGANDSGTGDRTDPGGAAEGRTGRRGNAADGATRDAEDPTEGGGRFRERPSQRTLGGAETAGTPEGFGTLPSMTVLGQFDGTYLVAETDDGLVLVDQHAADERVNYERLRAAVSGETTTQALAEPVDVEVTPREAALADSHGEALSRLGFRVGRPDDGTLSVRAVPALLAEHAGSDAPEVARDLLAAFVEGDPEGTVEALAEELLGDLACHPSVTANTSLSEGRVSGLLAALDECENPYACPHGRPTLIEIPTDEIEERFERDYPGHGGRRR
ncbi:DNA mismatch repair endonuclease MutL [Natronomonas sp.]|uniref:DNA mismatch repair endonuclease MutL n=1 Tax=Natronomonas sp. TaxID=2184060 RepID=UPI002612D78C|nr:DNA mismatch repair endonuclease MutL [Natronomonas sp.]